MMRVLHASRMALTASTFSPLCLIALVIVISGSLLQPRMLTRFCYNSPDPARVNSQCIYCNYYSFDNTILGCTGSSAVTVNMTATQAFCVIAQCLGQIRQIPIFLGRRKRSSAGDANDIEPAAANGLEEQLALEPDRGIRDDETVAPHGTSDDTSLLRPDGSRMEEIRFVLNGKEEKFIVAKEVEASVDRFADAEDYDFGL